MRQRRSFLLCAVASVAALCLTSCQSREDLEALIGTQVYKDRAPLVRPLPLTPMPEPMVVEFALPATRKKASKSFLVGLRISPTDGLRAYEAVDNVIGAGVQANVRLERIDQPEPSAVLLLQPNRDSKVPTDIIELVDGDVTGVWRTDPDTISMLESGLSEVDDDRRYLGFAWARDIPPGQYRLTIKIKQSSSDLEQIRSELLLAYRRTPK